MSDERRQRLAWRLVLLLGGVSVVCITLSVMALWLRPRQFTTHRDAIAYELAQRNISYEEVYFNQTWPDTMDSSRFATNVEIWMREGQRVPGYLACRSERTFCVFSAVSLGIVDQPLPELVAEREHPWIKWAQTVWDAVGLAP